MSALLEPPIRQEVVYAAPPPVGVAVERPLSRWQRLTQHALWRKVFILLGLALLWEGAARWTHNDLLLPGFIQTAQAFIGGIASGELLTR
ncbi:MAG: ABC transporter permease, partial [Janthinobacterium sp.]